ncbi:MAG: hypothetical protein ABS67_00625 [Niabella sp. SCN 42-15]|nr:MAG: hypothetical protein ABS67_00625 [Niabella sp. SCN 42-15]
MNKNILNLLLVAGFLLAITACKKEENRVIYKGGTEPVLTSPTAGPLVFVKENAEKNAVTFNWTNPNYMLSTGLSSQNVIYFIEIDTAGSNFTNPAKAEVAITSDLSKTFTVKELNTFLNAMDLAFGMAHQVEFRVKSTLANSSAPLYSNAVKMVITPYLDVAVPLPPTGKLYLTGSSTASGWTNNPPETQKFTQKSLTDYSIEIALIAGQVKFLSTPGNWQPQYGMVENKPGVLGANMGSGSDPKEIDIAASGTYLITVNFKTGRYTVEKK